ncbi:amino acid oxidase [Streptomyces sp. NRRL F-4489]|uniref:FAD-dependent oxidoreductase n=1 Tax=Streptomyces sp. NRRL F-4489 TaxID=1609095 RepID=UPI00074A3BB0|nr:FAD-dependent oxidoreductase [Streptomyces sp. NRRL F-4489]KUL48353.1 amino acid oxidase [Streptomyces sp. NRRL F-4489]
MADRRAAGTDGAGAAEICVVGAGVIGLTSAIVLAEAGYGVRVVARDTGGGTTSAVAGGLCWPYRIQPYAAAIRWSLRSLEVLTGLAAHPAETGARLVTGTLADASPAAVPEASGQAAAPGASRPPHAPEAGGGAVGPEAGLADWYAAVPGWRRARATELPAGCRSGWRARTPLVDMPVHLRYLERRLAAAGGHLVRRPVASLAEAAEGARTVVNCTGLGARDLAPDPQVRPVQGQLVIVENPGVTEWFTAADAGAVDTAYLLPQPFGLILGGTARPDAWSRDPDPAVARAIVARCAHYVPEVARARILAHRAGLRPARPAVRLAAERLPDGTLCVHNYGHGGAGITVSWGCAEEVLRLVRAGTVR